MFWDGTNMGGHQKRAHLEGQRVFSLNTLQEDQIKQALLANLVIKARQVKWATFFIIIRY
jgi:hypothetical protein